MLDSVKIAKRQSEFRQGLAAPAGKEKPTDDKGRQMGDLDREYQKNETRYRASLVAEDGERREAGRDLETRSDAQWREPWIPVSSATVDVKAAISSAMASAGVLQPRVFLGRLFIRVAISLSHVWLTSPRSVPFGMNWRNRPLVFSLLPRCQGACGSSEPDVDLQPPCQFGVAGHLGAAVVGHALAQRGGQALHLAGEAVENGIGAVAAHPAQNDEAGPALDQRARRGAVEGALDQIALPVAGHQPRHDLLGPVDNAQRFRDHGRARKRRAPAAPRGLRLPQGADHRRLQAAARLGVDRGMAGPPLGISLCDTLPVNAWLMRAEGSPGFMCRSLCAICSGDQHR